MQNLNSMTEKEIAEIPCSPVSSEVGAAHHIPKISRYPLESLADYTYRLNLAYETLNYAYRLGHVDALQRWKWVRELSDLDLGLLKLN